MRASAMKILVTGGGTGGHIYPALALIERISDLHSNTEFLYVGTERGLESRIVPRHGVPFTAINVEGFKRDLSFAGLKYNLKTVRLFLSSMSKAKKIIKDFKPDAVIGTGGYVSAPVCYAASKLSIPTIVHEQNSVAGVTNKFLAKHVSAIAVGFQEAINQFKGNEHKVHFTGNPRAQEVALLEKTDILNQYNLDPSKETVVIFGGSRGAQKINEVVTDSMSELIKRPYQILFVTGEDHYEKVAKEIGELDSKRIKVVPYINQLPEVFASVSLVVCRSGATTLSEITSLGVPSILIPSPFVTEDHQTKNAQSLEVAGAARLIKEDSLNPTTLLNELDDLMLNEDKRVVMATESKKLGKQNASDLLIKLIVETIR